MTRQIEGIQMDGTRLRHLRTLLVGLALVAGVVRVDAYPSYDDHSGPGGTSGVGCVSCHPRYYDDPSSPTPFGPLHTAHLVKFGISRCGLCHMSPSGGDIPVLTYTSAEGFGCAGCHGQDYGETIPTGFVNAGAHKASAYGLRKSLDALFAAMQPPQPAPCGGCHFPGSPTTGDPSPAPALFDETVAPPYYNTTSNNLTDPCDSSQESWDGTPPGLDNDGNGFADYAADSACQAFVPTTTTTTTTTPVSSTTTTTLAGAKRITVYPGQSIQDAVDALAPGGKLYVMPGTYQETHGGTNAVTVSKDGIRLIGRSKPKAGLKVVLQAGPGNHNGIVVQGLPDARIDGSQIKGFTIQGFPNNGILTRYLDNFKIERNESIDNLENGIWPTLSANGVVKKNVSYGSQDSALWVEASENVRVLKNDLHHSPTGLEITISHNIVAKGNEVHHNTAGIGLYHAYGAGLPPLQPPDQNGDWQFIDNWVHDNNEPNSAPPGSLSASLPVGLGVALIGVDRVTLKNNRIENNNTIGLAISEWCSVAGNCPPTPPPNFPDTLPDYNTIVSNVITNNASAPSSGYEGLAADITYVAIGAQGNCFADNTYGTILNVGGPAPSNKCP